MAKNPKRPPSPPPAPANDPPRLNTPFAGLAKLREELAGSAAASAPTAPTAATAPTSPPTAQPPAPSAKLGAKLVLQREKKGRGGKTVTRIHGLELSARALEALVSDLKRGLGCGATLEDGDILLQGDLTERAAELLKKKGAQKVVIGN
ncbi:MAG: translation initiation factor [Deltaproteobacteria bacterium]|nr:translation initiation factor [Deltaproteobacteria bacterium]